MKTHKVDVVSGYSYPQDNHALWFDESQNVLKKYDGAKWVSGSAVSNGEKNFYYKEEVVPEQVIWEGNAHNGDRIENFIQEPVAGEQYIFELSDGRTYQAYWGDENDFVIFSGLLNNNISVGYRLFDKNDYGWVFINYINNTNLVKISTEETTQNILVWNYQDSLPIAMPKCIKDDELGLVAVFDEGPEEGKAYYIPYIGIDEGELLGFIPMLFCDNGEFCLCGLDVTFGLGLGGEYQMISSITEHGTIYYIIKNDDEVPGGKPDAEPIAEPGSGGEAIPGGGK